MPVCNIGPFGLENWLFVCELIVVAKKSHCPPSLVHAGQASGNRSIFPIENEYFMKEKNLRLSGKKLQHFQGCFD